MLGIKVVERFDHGPADLLFSPAIFGQAIFDSVDATITLPRIIVARIHHNHALRCFREQTAWQGWNVPQWHRHNDYLTSLSRLLNCDRSRAGLGCQVGQRFRSSRIRDENLVPKRSETTSQRAANVACS